MWVTKICNWTQRVCGLGCIKLNITKWNVESKEFFISCYKQEDGATALKALSRNTFSVASHNAQSNGWVIVGTAYSLALFHFFFSTILCRISNNQLGIFELSPYACTDAKRSKNLATAPHMVVAGQPDFPHEQWYFLHGQQTFPQHGPFTHACFTLGSWLGSPIVRRWMSGYKLSLKLKVFETKKWSRWSYIHYSFIQGNLQGGSGGREPRAVQLVSAKSWP